MNLRRIRYSFALRWFWIRGGRTYGRWSPATMWRFATAPIRTIPTLDEILPKVCAEIEATPEQGAAIFDLSARRLFGISGPEWLERYSLGEYRGSDDPRVASLMMLIPFVQPVLVPARGGDPG